MKYFRLAVIPLLALILVGCQSTGELAQERPQLRPGTTKIALMPIDVQLFELTAGGVEEPKADWTRQAEVHVRNAIGSVQTEKQLKLVEFDASSLTLERQQVMNQLVKLHQVVGLEAFLQNRIPQRRPPTKQGNFDWSIGTEVQTIAQATGARYGLFVYMKDSYSSGGRVALKIALAILGVSAQGGTQLGYASLVDLQTGQIAWFGTLLRGVGDLREAEPAEDAVRAMFATLTN